MALELIFVGLSTALALCVLWFGAVSMDLVLRRSRARSERSAFWLVVAPVVGAGLVMAFFIGWAAQEPDPSDEWLGAGLWCLSGITMAAIARASIRAARGLRVPSDLAIGTVGLLAPRIVVSCDFERAAGEESLNAALAHEAAHQRHRDPLRIWLVAFAADLQWPLPGARARFDRWLLALEVERDEEALARGADRGALAAAIVAAARLTSRSTGAAVAAAGAEPGVAIRVRRLLRGDSHACVRRPRPWSFAVIGASVLLMSWLGHGWGDALLGILPGVGR